MNGSIVGEMCFLYGKKKRGWKAKKEREERRKNREGTALLKA